MSWQDILVFADGSNNGLARVNMAADLAVEIGAGLEVCVPASLPPLSTAGGVDFMIEYNDEVERGAREDAARAVVEIQTRVPALARRLQITTPEARLPDLPRLAGHLGQACDLVILGQPIAEDASKADDALLQGALFHSGRPCLMFPRWDSSRHWGSSILIAWKGTAEAARAVHDAIPLLRKATSVRLVTIQHGSHLDRSLDQSAERLVRHLSSFGVRTRCSALLRDGPDGDALLEHVKEWSTDLVVMGAFGHSRVRERILGGATQTMLRHSPVPVLFSH
jgi:nucleotide-binding universal stress UspA family protein